MGRISESHLSCKIILGFSIVCLMLYGIAIPQPYWLRFRTTVPANPPLAPVPVRIKVHIGLYRACKNVKARVPQGTLVIEDWCRSKHAPDWHKTCAVMGVLAMLSALAQHVVYVLNIMLKRMANRTAFKLVSAGCSALAVGFMIPVLILIDVNRENYNGVDYDLYYCYILAIIGMIFYFLLTLMILLQVYFYSDVDRETTSTDRLWTEEKNGEASSRYT